MNVIEITELFQRLWLNIYYVYMYNLNNLKGKNERKNQNL